MVHLVILQHGLWGSPSNTACLARLLAGDCGDLHVVNSDVNSGLRTYDGVDVCGNRLVELVQSESKALCQRGTPPTRLSVVTYSMGGLAARYAVGRLHAAGYFSTVRAMNFITVATPHLGSMMPPTTLFNRLRNALAPVAAGRSSRQLYLQDVAPPYDVPLLYALADPQLEFLPALSAFPNIVALGNVRNDVFVAYPTATATLQAHNPFAAGRRGVGWAPSNPTYPSIVRALEPGEAPPSPARPLRGRVLLTLAVIAAVLLLPLTLLGLALMLLHGRLHCQLAERRQRARLQHQRRLDSSSAGVGDAGRRLKPDAGGSAATASKSADSPLTPWLPGQPDTVDVEVRAGAGDGAGDGGGSAGGGAGGYSVQQLPTDPLELQARMVAHLSSLPVRRVAVDTCNVLNAHAAIIVYSEPMFSHCKDVLHYIRNECFLHEQ